MNKQVNGIVDGGSQAFDAVLEDKGRNLEQSLSHALSLSRVKIYIFSSLTERFESSTTHKQQVCLAHRLWFPMPFSSKRNQGSLDTRLRS